MKKGVILLCENMDYCFFIEDLNTYDIKCNICSIVSN